VTNNATLTRSAVKRLVQAAFAAETYPGDNHIVHCEYDREWGGTLDGPCRECSEVVDYFHGRSRKRHRIEKVHWVKFALRPFTPAAFRYWLPTFITLALSSSEYAGGIGESIEFRFDSSEATQWQDDHIGTLKREQLEALEAYFKFQYTQPSEHKPSVEDCLRTISRYLETKVEDVC
jgi:hypothetical protein